MSNKSVPIEALNQAELELFALKEVLLAKDKVIDTQQARYLEMTRDNRTLRVKNDRMLGEISELEGKNLLLKRDEQVAQMSVRTMKRELESVQRHNATLLASTIKMARANERLKRKARPKAKAKPKPKAKPRAKKK